MNSAAVQHFDVLIVGSGLAGQSLALRLADSRRVALVTKKALADSASAWAQGGIAAVLDPADSVEAHVNDTFTAGAGLCDPAATRFVVEHGREAIEWLITRGVRFTPDDSPLGFHLTREGGHGQRRIIHAADATGSAVQQTLTEQVKNHPNITVLENHIAIDLITASKLGLPRNRCLGAYVLDIARDRVHTLGASHTALATGGAGKVYLYTSNPDTATGDGVAMAWRAGCRMANMEFIQFHPTCLYHPRAKSFLISEAVRGEGGVLKSIEGVEFMDQSHPLKSLAPRDIVARAIDSEMKKSGADYVLLDITNKPARFIIDRFPNIYQTCLRYGIDITKEPIPVVPAAHYQCGGVLTNVDGETEIGGLYAVGEVACTGLHGANRLASNSLLEAMVCAHRASKHVIAHQPKPADFKIPPWHSGNALNPDEMVVVSHNWDEIRRLLWDYVGIVRTNKRLQRARNRIANLQGEIQEYYWDFIVTSDLLELRNLATVAELIVECALRRPESRGLHYNLDYPQSNPDWAQQDTVLRKSP